MTGSIQRGLDLLKPGSIVPVDVKTVADLYAALRYVVGEQKIDEPDDYCPSCRQDRLLITGTYKHMKCGTCGYFYRIESEEL